MNRICLMVFIFILVFSLLGCQSEIQSGLGKVEKQESETVIIKASESDPRTNEYSTKLNEFSYDFDSDQEEEKIELYTVAGRDENGRMAWDDGQKWLLVVVDKNRYYPLFSEGVQLGQVYFNVSTIGEEKVAKVSVLVSTRSSIEIKDFVFNFEKEYFEGKVKYRQWDMIQNFTSIPNY